MSEVVKIKLSKPIQAHGRQVAELTLREPTGNMFLATVTSTAEICQQLLPTIADIPPSSVEQICYRDMRRCMAGITHFLEEREPKESWMHILPAPISGTTSTEFSV